MDYRFQEVRLALAEPNRQLRFGIRSLLFAAGFRDIVDFADFEGLREHIEKAEVDAVISEAQLPGGNVCDMLRLVRHHRLGNNPFILAIALTFQPTQEIVRDIVDSGFDDLVIKPISGTTLVERLRMLARGRKPFVVTHDYIGPDRRKQSRDDAAQPIPLLQVPNPLRARAVTNTDTASLQRMIDAAIVKINEHKLERYAVQISYLSDRLTARYESDSALPGCEDDLKYLCYVAEDLARRVRGTQFQHVTELALSLISIGERLIVNAAAPDRRDVELLPKIAQAFARAFEPAEATKRLTHEISQSIRNFTPR